ncbi:MAG: hypothetical protein ACI8QS_001166 [Planctomycetota bacterium]|jgi:hypothetical protein
MGNLEKLVVLTVLFLSAIVLAVQLNDGSDELGSNDPNTAAADLLKERAGDTLVDAAAGEQDADEEEGREGDMLASNDGSGRPIRGGDSMDGEATNKRSIGPTLLDSGVFPKGGDSEATGGGSGTVTSPYGSDSIVIATGLRPAGVPGMLLMDLTIETTWAELAQAIYGDDRYVALLQSFNEEMYEAPQIGEIVVPIQDNTGAAGIVGNRRPRSVASPAEARPRSGASAPATNIPRSTAAGVSYTVRDGDSLSKISELFYGTKHRWKEIYDANRDVMDTPDRVKLGMVLLIPGAKASVGIR